MTKDQHDRCPSGPIFRGVVAYAGHSSQEMLIKADRTNWFIASQPSRLYSYKSITLRIHANV